jgi:hypothetical protein
MDNYAYATTSPIYISVGGRRRKLPPRTQNILRRGLRGLPKSPRNIRIEFAARKELVMGRLQAGQEVYERCTCRAAMPQRF